MKSLINYTLLKEQLKRFWAIAALSLLWYILFAVSPLYSNISAGDYEFAAESIVSILAMQSPVIQFSMVAVPFVAVLATFSYLFQPKSTTAAHSWPLSKGQLYCTNLAAGFILIVIPLLILCAFLLRPVFWRLPEMRITPEGIQYMGYVPSLPVELFPNGLTDGMVINTLPVIAAFFMRALMTLMFYYALFATAVMVVGNAVVYVLLSGVIPFIPCAFMLIAFVTGSYYFFGFDDIGFSEAILSLLIYTNPAAFGSAFHAYRPTGHGVPPTPSNLLVYYGVYIAIAAALYAVSFWCSGVRRQERAGDSVVFIPLRNVLIFLLSLAGLIFLGTFFLGIFKNIWLMYFGFALGFAIAYFIAQMIAEKTFNVVYKAREIVKFGGIMAALLLIVVIVARFDLLGYQTYSPQASEVEGVYLHPYYTLRNKMGVNGEENMLDFYVTDEKVIADALSVHKEIIGERHSLRSTFLRSLEGNINRDEIKEQSFLFLLKNGKTVNRTYMLPKDFCTVSGLDELMMEEVVILSQYVSFSNPDDIDRISLQFNYRHPENQNEIIEKEYASKSSEAIYIEDADDIVSVLEEIKKDIVINERERLKNPDNDKSGGVTISGHAELANMDGSYWTSDYFDLYSHENVGRWLESRGLRPEPIEK